MTKKEMKKKRKKKRKKKIEEEAPTTPSPSSLLLHPFSFSTALHQLLRALDLGRAPPSRSRSCQP
jgi:hypothetical protein